MRREVYALGYQPHGTISIMVELDKEAFDQLLSAYKAAWALPRRNRYWGENVAHLQFVREVLKAAEEACDDKERKS